MTQAGAHLGLVDHLTTHHVKGAWSTVLQCALHADPIALPCGNQRPGLDCDAGIAGETVEVKRGAAGLGYHRRVQIILAEYTYR
ncbi:hypothetical protein D3C77_539650 [compost metagenome]